MKTETLFAKAAPAAVLTLLLALNTSLPPAQAAGPVTLTLKGRWPAHARGLAQDVAVQGHYAYVAASEGGLIIVDVSDSANLVAVGGFDPGGSNGAYFRGVAVSGDYAYAVDDYAGFHVIDVSAPSNPRRVGGYDTSSWAMGVAVSGDYAYVADGSAGLQVIAISDPLTPVRVGGADVGNATTVFVSGSYAFVANGGLEILDVSDPTRPVPMGSFETAGPIADVAVSGNYAYVAERGVWESPPYAYVGGGWHVLDVSDPGHPVRVAGVNDLNATSITVAGDNVYVGVASSGWNPATSEVLSGSLLVFNVSDPTAPTLAGGSDPHGTYGPNAIAVSGDVAFVADSTVFIFDYPEGEGLISYDVSDPAAPVRLTSFQTDGYFQDVAISGNHAYVTAARDGVVVFDVRNPGAPARVAGYASTELQYADHVSVLGDFAYVNGSGLDVLDVSDPANPMRVGGADVYTYADGMVASGHYLYLAAEDAGLLVMDVSDPAHPVTVGGYDANTGLVWSVAVSGNLAYVVDSDDVRLHSPGQGLVVLDVSNPRQPVRLGQTGSLFGAHAVLATSGHYAYVAHGSDSTTDGVGGFQVFDVSDPARPFRIGELGDIEDPQQIAASGQYVYLLGSWIELGARWRQGLLVLDVSDPIRPVRVGRYETGEYGDGFAVAGSLLYVVGHTHGLQILELSRTPWLNVSGVSPFTFSISGEPGASVRVQRSTNLNDWEDWQNVTLSETPFDLSDPEGVSSGAQFYRAIQP